MLEQIYHFLETQDNPMQPFVMSGFGNTSNLKVPAEFPSLPVVVEPEKKGYKQTHTNR
jgi:hypothetical protein